MLASVLTFVALTSLAADAPTDPRMAVRGMLTEGWQVGSFATAWKHAEGLGDARSKPPAATAIALLQMRHNLFVEAREGLKVQAADSTDPLTLAALAWTEAAAGEHVQALKTFERAARAVDKKNALQAELVSRALGTYFGFLECHDVGNDARTAYRAARDRMIGLASQENQVVIAQVQSGVEQRLGKFADASVPRDPAAIEAERKQALADVDRRLNLLTTEYQKHAKQAVTLAEQVRALQVERNKHLDNPNGQAYRELNQAAAARAVQQRESESKAAVAAEKARELTQQRKAISRRYDELIDRSKIIAAPAPMPGAAPIDDTPPHVKLGRAGQFPLDVGRQLVLRSLLAPEDAKAVNKAFRVWTNRNGAMMFVAEMLRVDVDRVVLRNPAGKEASLELAALSHADQDYVDATGVSLALDVPSALAPDLGKPETAGNPASIAPATTASLFNVKVLSATWGTGDKTVDVTEKIRAYVAADPFAPVQGDGHIIGDPAPGVHKQLALNLEIDGKPVAMNLNDDVMSTLPAVPAEGISLASASKDLRILAARYGAGMRYIDVTAAIQQRAVHPGLPIYWNGFTNQDPVPGAAKNVTVWFDYLGKRFVRVFPINHTKPLMDGMPPPDPKAIAPFTALIKQDAWSHDVKKPVRLASNDRAFGIITELAGHFGGHGEKVELRLDTDQTWLIQGHTVQPLVGRAMAITAPLRDKFLRKPEEHVWNPGMKRVKMLATSEGFCVLAGAGGRFGGGGEWACVTIDKDGYWYLEGGGGIQAKAIAYRLKPNAGVKLRYVEHFVSSAGYKIMDKDQGFCYLSCLHGAFNGFGEIAKVVRAEDGHWDLIGQNCSARAIAVYVDEPAFVPPPAAATSVLPASPDLPATSAQELPKFPCDAPVEIVKARYGAGGSWADVTEKVSKFVATDPFSPIHPDDRIFGDPASGQKKVLEITYKIDGKEGSMALQQHETCSMPSFPSDGMPVKNATQEFRLIAVKYGAGLTWIDVTKVFLPRVKHPGQSVEWGAFEAPDPWFGVNKRIHVFFDYQGKRYSRIFAAGAVDKLMKEVSYP